MGLILIPSEVIQKVDMLKNSLDNVMESYRSALQVIQNFADSTDIDTQTWDKLKAKAIDYHQAIVQGMIAAEDSILVDVKYLKQSVGSEELDEDQLKAMIDKLKEEKQECMEEINELQSLKGNWFVGLFDFACDFIDGLIETLQVELERIQEVLDEFQIKLNTLITIELSTKSMFEDAIQILSAVKAAINDAGVEVTGVGEMSDLDWKITLTNANAEMDEKVRLFIEEALKSELQIELDEIEEIYGSSIVEYLVDIMNENEISRLDSAASEKFIKAVITAMTGYQVDLVGEKYQYVDTDGIIKEFTGNILENGFEVYRYMNISSETAQWYIDNVSTYCHMTRDDIDAAGAPSIEGGRKDYTCNLPGNLDGITVGDDCSGFVWATLVQAGYFDSSTKQYATWAYFPGQDGGNAMVEAGFTWHPMTELTGDDIRTGDILLKNGHIEIFYGYDDKGRELAMTWGDVYEKLPAEKNVWKNTINQEYRGIWRLDP